MGAQLVHFEIVAEDDEKLAKFYSEALGWEIGEPQEEFGGYTDVMPSDREGAIHGGLYKRTMPEQTWLDYFEYGNIEYLLEEIKKNGGQVIMDRMALPGMGWMAVCLDPEGNPFGLWQTDELAK